MENNPYAVDGIYYILPEKNITQNKRYGDNLCNENNKSNRLDDSNHFSKIIYKTNNLEISKCETNNYETNISNKKRKIQSIQSI